MSLCILTQDAFMYTGWRRLIGSPKSQIIFHKRATSGTTSECARVDTCCIPRNFSCRET